MKLSECKAFKILGYFVVLTILQVGLPWWLSGKESACFQERQVHFLGWEESLEKEMATHSGILAWEIPCTEIVTGCSPWGCRVAGYHLVTKQHFIGNRSGRRCAARIFTCQPGAERD